MDHSARHAALLTALEGLRANAATDVTPALTQAAQIVVAALRADKADVFLYVISRTSWWPSAPVRRRWAASSFIANLTGSQ